MEKRKKFYLREEDRNEEEKRTGKASYFSVIDRYITDLVLCNNIAEVDDSIWDNIEIGEYSDNIYQYYLCNLGQWDYETLEEYKSADIIISYSNLLDCDVLMVDHFGTSWKYVMTDIDLTDNINE